MIVNDKTINGNKKMMRVIKRIDKAARALFSVSDTYEDFSVCLDDTGMAIFRFVFSELSLDNAMLVHCLMGREIPALCGIYMEYMESMPNKRVSFSVWIDEWESAL